MSLKSSVKKIIPGWILNVRHLWYAWYGSRKYGQPSEKLLVIGVTGTSGKSTTVTLLRQMLEHAGFKVGSLSTIDFYINGESKLNDQKMTMLGKMQIQKYVREMVDKGCEIAILETTSEGAVQYRNRFINYDIMILTNLYPEHIESHGSFENYKKAKLGIFRRASMGRRKVLTNPKFESLFSDKSGEIEKMAIVNGDIAESEEFLETGRFGSRLVFGNIRKTKNFNEEKIKLHGNVEVVYGESIRSDSGGLHFRLDGHDFDVAMFGEHNVMNILATLGVGKKLGLDWPALRNSVQAFTNVPGRNEFVPEAEQYGFKVIVDYSFEPRAIAALYEVVRLLKPSRVIHVFGSTGGGRDVDRRFTVGEYVGKHADICIVTDEDPYDDDPQKIIDDVAGAVEKTGKQKNIDLFCILDRKEAIKKAIELAGVGDLVLITGKGSEQAMCVAKGNKISWDDRLEVRDALNMLSKERVAVS